MSKETIGLLTAVIALIAALVGLTTSLVNRQALVNQQRQLTKQSSTLDQQQRRLADQDEQLEQMRKVVDNIVPAITIERPRAGEVLPPIYYEMGGSFKGRVPPGYRLWVLARDALNFYLMKPPTQVVSTEQRWSQSQVRLDTSGNWELLLCIGNDVASKWLQGRMNPSNDEGFSVLPDGLEVLRTVAVRR